MGPSSTRWRCAEGGSKQKLVGKGHAEFATGKQQDAVEYFQHLHELMTREERATKVYEWAATPPRPPPRSSSLSLPGLRRICYGRRPSPDNVFSLDVLFDGKPTTSRWRSSKNER